jgi:thioester reductase-like protein
LTHPTVERITQTASHPAGLNILIRILRVGQLCGSTRTGLWNTSDMYPILFATSFHPRMRCIPTFPTRPVDWVPIDTAARTISQLLLLSPKSPPHHQHNPPYTVHNIVNPHPISWPALLSILNHPLQEIPMKDWVRRLTILANDGLAADADAVPGLRLLGFFERMATDARGAVFETARTRELSPALRACGPVCKEWIDANLETWRRDGFF